MSEPFHPQRTRYFYRADCGHQDRDGNSSVRGDVLVMNLMSITAAHVAEAAAAQVHKVRGRPVDWPLKVNLWDEAGKDLGCYEVFMEMVPEFSAVKKEES